MIEHGDCVELMAAMPAGCVDAVVTDPPYGIGFMGKAWDGADIAAAVARDEVHRYDTGPASDSRDGRMKGRTRSAFGNPGGYAGSYRREGDNTKTRARPPSMHAGKYDLSPDANHDYQQWCRAWALEALRVLKPGGHLVSFGGTRTSHRLVSGIEDAGFEIRDTLVWLFGSGFPKSLNLDGEHRGWGTALKPAYEPIVLARKPLAGTVAGNVAAHGTGALNVDGCRIGTDDDLNGGAYSAERQPSTSEWVKHGGTIHSSTGREFQQPVGRWPANVTVDSDAAALIDQQSGELTSGANPTRRGSDKFRLAYGDFVGQRECTPARGIDIGGASRFFYCAKTSGAERNAGLDGFPAQGTTADGYGSIQTPTLDRAAPRENWTPHPVRNTHPTVKPIDLMRWLVRLVTPTGGLVLDPFAGSGTTGIAAGLEGMRFIGIEREADYIAIARARLDWWARHPDGMALIDRLEHEHRQREHRDAGQLAWELG